MDKWGGEENIVPAAWYRNNQEMDQQGGSSQDVNWRIITSNQTHQNQGSTIIPYYQLLVTVEILWTQQEKKKRLKETLFYDPTDLKHIVKPTLIDFEIWSKWYTIVQN